MKKTISNEVKGNVFSMSITTETTESLNDLQMLAMRIIDELDSIGKSSTVYLSPLDVFVIDGRLFIDLNTGVWYDYNHDEMKGCELVVENAVVAMIGREDEYSKATAISYKQNGKLTKAFTFKNAR